ncbi:HisA/HisF-related TIM barrel protein [Synechococcus sp. AH-707-M23]|nr:HisA/HisF-related TIM barrel protein [Synechococcus sp. AH-707-M23]
MQNAVKILEQRKVDEISIIRYCRENDDVNDFNRDLDLIANIDCITPLSFGGGIRDSHILQKLHQLPIERLLLNSAYMQKNQDLIEQAIQIFGKQALIAVLPYRVSAGKLQYFHSSANSFHSCDLDFVNKFSNEVMFYNTELEGVNHSIHPKICDFPLPCSKIILSGGINRALIKKLRHQRIAAVCIDNVSLHHEFNFNQL